MGCEKDGGTFFQLVLVAIPGVGSRRPAGPQSQFDLIRHQLG